MKKASIVLTVLAWLFLIGACMAGFIEAIMKTSEMAVGVPFRYRLDMIFELLKPYYFVAGGLWYVLLGLIAHILVNKYRAKNGGGLLAVYILTFPAYLVPFILLFALFLILKFIDIMIGLFTGGEHSLASITSFVYDAAFGSYKKTKPSSGDTYVVIENGYERHLQCLEQKSDSDPNSPFYTKNYNRFRDDTGCYWRSYDNNVNFIKETVQQVSQGY